MRKRIPLEERNEKGFTLIEMLVVVVIIGLLAMIAIPQFAQYKGRAHCSRLESDAVNAVAAMEAYFAAHFAYGTLTDAGFTESSGVSVEVISTEPLVIQATDETVSCPEGNVFTISQGQGTWS